MLAAIRRASSLLSQLGLKCLLYPQKRTSELGREMSAMCQKRTLRTAASLSYSITSPAVTIDY